jgi:glucose-1-phosphate thymidylyltransferase
MSETTKAVILARGLGTRMRRAADVAIDSTQAAVADTGVKAMIPIGRPFLDFVLGAVADAGITDVCLVVGPEHDAIRRYYGEELELERLQIAFATQQRPLGTADAVLAAEPFAADDHFLVINSDNYYTPDALARLRSLGRSGLVGFEQDALVREGNIDASRVVKFAAVTVDSDGCLADLIEKPDEETWRRLGAHALISMNCWSFGPSIFEAARRIEPSPRGELEVTDAVRYAKARLGVRFAVVPVAAPVLDLSMRSDIPSVARRLEGMDVRL